MRSGFCFFTMLMVAFGVSAFGYDWSTNPGDGSPENPYQISEPNHLIAIGSNADLLDKHFILMNDIIFDPENNPAHVFDNALIAPDTNNSTSSFTGTKFSGVFDGQNHGIYNFKCIDPTGYYIGLFGYIAVGGEVINLHFHNINIEGNRYVGGLVGMNYGFLENCSMEGIVSGTEDIGGLIGMNEEGGFVKDCYCDISLVNHGYLFAAGGLVGYNFFGDIVNCNSSGVIDGGDDSYMLGGIAGFNRGRIRQCHSSVDVSGLWYIGGLIGQHDRYELVACYATGYVWGEEGCGGLIGRNYWDASYCYAMGNVEGTGYGCGGLIGENWSGNIRQCYSVGNVIGVSAVGGLIGIGNQKTQSINCFWDINTSGQTESFGGTGLDNPNMMVQANFVGWDFVGESDNGVNEIWRMCADGVDYPRLSWEFAKNGDFACGDGVDLADLLALAEHWLLTEAANPTTFNYACDANGDEEIDLEDFGKLAENWE